MALLHCEVLDGPREGFKAVGIPSVEGHTEWLSIEDRFLVWRDKKAYIPVGIVGRDPRYDTILVQLPLEADSGANRVWVWQASVLQNETEAVLA